MSVLYKKNGTESYRRYGKGILFSNGIALNETATYIFDMCDGEISFQDILDNLRESYQCDNETLSDDLKACLEYMEEKGLIEALEKG